MLDCGFVDQAFLPMSKRGAVTRRGCRWIEGGRRSNDEAKIQNVAVVTVEQWRRVRAVEMEQNE